MKKIIAWILAVLTAFALTACSGGSDSGENPFGGTILNGSGADATEEPVKPRTVADDDSVLSMCFTPLTEFESVNRLVGVDAAGNVTTKEIEYTLKDNANISFNVIAGHQLTEIMDPAAAETMEGGGVTFYLKSAGIYLYAFTQRGDLVYAVIDKDPSGEHPRMEEAMKTLRFTDTTDTELNEDTGDLYDIRYSFDSTWKVAATTSALEEDKDAQVICKACEWSIGLEEGQIDFDFSIYVYRGQSLTDALSADQEYTEQTVNGINYLVVSDLQSYSCYTQHGSDVYCIRNNGVSNGMWNNRSEASNEAFDKLLNSISFQ